MRTLLLVSLLAFSLLLQAQDSARLQVEVYDLEDQPIEAATLSLFRTDTVQVHTTTTDSRGHATLAAHAAGQYLLRATRIGFNDLWAHVQLAAGVNRSHTLHLNASAATLKGVTVSTRKALIELQPDKTVVHVDALLTNTGTSVLEALEKMPGVLVDKDGRISLKGRSGVLVLIDGKQTYLGAAELATLLQGMSSAQVSQVELMDQPPARYDAAGNAGIINIKTKKNRQKGFNGALTLGLGQGVYPKTNNSLQLNYRKGKVNTFVNYSTQAARQFTRIEALRRYLAADGFTVERLLNQPSYLKTKAFNNNLRVGIDYEANTRTTLGLVASGAYITRNSNGHSLAQWQNAANRPDSLIETTTANTTRFHNAGLNLNLRKQVNSRTEYSADIDLLTYRIRGTQAFENHLTFPGTYTEIARAGIPSAINILSAKADYATHLGKVKVESGWKSSFITTDNEARYQYQQNGNWMDDLGKSNHFLYNENINALYGNAATQQGRWKLQGGLRYEQTHYQAKQLGNALQRDSVFSRTYNGLFPTLFASFQADSAHVFTFSGGRRIDRPAFQKLNPFLFVINKYTYQQGNPYFRPQYTWNIEAEHQYNNTLSTSLGYSITTDYFSQVFPINSNGIVLYTEGNLDRLQVWSASVGYNATPAAWWQLHAQAVFNYKKMEGFVGKPLKEAVQQYTLNLNNQFRMGKGWSGELTGLYTSRSRNDIQELIDPAGQLSIGVAKQVLGQKGTLKCSFRDVLYTQWMKGTTYFQLSDEYFKLTRDTRVALLSFSWRFGKAYKTARRSEGAADAEKARVGTGN